MNVERELIKDIKITCPFYDVDFPKTISCTRVEPSKYGYEIELDDFGLTDTPYSPKGFETLIKELDFVKQVLLQSDYIKK